MTHTIKSLVQLDVSREHIEEWCRSQACAVPIAAEQPLLLCRVLGKYLIYALARDSALTPHLAMKGIWEPWVTMAIARHLKPGMRCIDVGACYGYYSVLMADLVGPTGAVDAWEPIHHDLVRLNRNVNGVSVNVLPYVMGARDENLVSMVPDRGFGGLFNAGGARTVLPESMACRSPHAVRVDMVKPGGFQADFIKIDVEGAEQDVWESLDYLTGSTKPLTVCMEFTPHKHQKPEEFLDSICCLGFYLHTIAPDGSTPAISVEDAVKPDTGEFRMLWLERK